MNEALKIARLERENADLRRSVDELAKSTKHLVQTTRDMVAAFKFKESAVSKPLVERRASSQIYDDYIARSAADPKIVSALRQADDAFELADDLNNRLDALQVKRCFNETAGRA